MIHMACLFLVAAVCLIVSALLNQIRRLTNTIATMKEEHSNHVARLNLEHAEILEAINRKTRKDRQTINEAIGVTLNGPPG